MANRRPCKPAQVPEGVHPLSRLENERHDYHRGFLLYALQDPDCRTVGSVARGLGREASTVAYWRKRWSWQQRLDAAGPGAQGMALQTYCEQYRAAEGNLASSGRLSLEAVAPNCSLEIPGLRPDEDELRRQYVPDDLKVARKGAVLIDAAIARAAHLLNEKRMVIHARDLPFLVAARRTLARDILIMESGEDGGVQGPIELPESVRVKNARATNGDVMQALADDANDLAILMRAILNQQTADALQGASGAPESRAASGGTQGTPAPSGAA